MANEINMSLEEFQQRERAASLMADELSTLRAENQLAWNTCGDAEKERDQLRAENESLKADFDLLKPNPLCDIGCMLSCSMESKAEITELTRQRDEYKQQNADLIRITLMMRDWIDAVPQDTELPAMPGFDRDWANSIIDAAIQSTAETST